MSKSGKVAYLVRDIEKIKSVIAIFTSIASFLRFFEFFMALFQGISYWLETLQAGQAERGFCLACLRISNFREKSFHSRLARQENFSAWLAWRVSSQ